MARTKVLFAFGEHGVRSDPRSSLDRNFFRGTILPFLEHHVSERRPAFILPELVITDFKDHAKTILALPPAERPTRLQLIQLFLSDMETRLNTALEAYLSAGRSSPFTELFDWGYMDAVLAINRDRPGAVRMLVEPQFAEGLFAEVEAEHYFFQSMEGLDGLEDLAVHIRACAKSKRIRSSGIKMLMDSLRHAYPNAVFIVPRGYHHKWMVDLFPPADYEVTSFARISTFDSFISDAITARNRDVDPHLLLQYAALELAYLRHFTPRADTLIAHGVSPEEESRQLNMFSAESKRHAIVQHPDIARELGYTI